MLKILLIIFTVFTSNQVNCLSWSVILKILKTCGENLGFDEDPKVNFYNMILISIIHYFEYKRKLELTKKEKEIDIIDDINKMGPQENDIGN